MITLYDRMARGHTQTGWLDSRHSFSFGDYRDPKRMGFHALRVINEDVVVPGAGFATHSHADMEIVTYVLEGALAHKDSLGNGSEIFPGDVQRMSAGTGIAHSEFNPSPSEKVHLLQIWILPVRRGLTPSYEQTHFTDADLRGRLKRVGDPEGADGAVTIHQDVKLFASRLAAGGRLAYAPAQGRGLFVQLARGTLAVNGIALRAGDGLALEDEDALDMVADTEAELLLFDLA